MKELYEKSLVLQLAKMRRTARIPTKMRASRSHIFSVNFSLSNPTSRRSNYFDLSSSLMEDYSAMRYIGVIFALAVALGLSVVSISAQTDQQKEAARIATREKLRSLLESSGQKKGINISFKQSEKQPFNFVG